MDISVVIIIDRGVKFMFVGHSIITGESRCGLHNKIA